MITELIILGLCIIIVLIGAFILDDFIKNILCMLCVILGIRFGYLLCISISDIPAIEVYRGNTTLQITYEGDTPIDSTVVWKKVINKNEKELI